MEKTAIVKCILRYFDIEFNRYVFKGEKIEVSLNRSVELINNKPQVCELIEIK
jgi:hypothetical protein